MDLLTLVTICSIGFDPRAMHSLVVAESEGKPFSYRSAEGKLHNFATMDAAIAAARRAQGKRPTIRIGLTGFETNLFGATAEPNAGLFEPCPNVALASLRLQKLRAHCAEKQRFRNHETWCAIALWRGNWERMNTPLADRVMTALAIGDLPNPELPDDCKCPEFASAKQGHDAEIGSWRATKPPEKAQRVNRDGGPIFVVRGGQLRGETSGVQNGLFVPLSGQRNQP